MAIKAATPELRSRINKAASMIGRGVNQDKPEVELEGRRQSALAHIENQILLGRHLLTSEECRHLAELLFSTNDSDLDDEDYTADAVETTKEALARSATPASYLEEDEDDIA